MTAVHGAMSAFNSSVENWRAYVERLEQYFVANEIESAERKRAILLSVCGAKTYQLIRDLTSPAKPAEKSYAEIVDLVTKHFSPKPSVVMQRCKFNARYQGKDETIATYVAALRQLSEFCQFGDGLNERLRDRIVEGVHNEKIQLRLLAEPDLTYERSLQLAQAMETAEHDRRQMKGGQEDKLFYHHGKPKKPRSPKVECYRCGGGHLATACRFKDTECRNCGKKGHIARACRSKKKEGGDPKPPKPPKSASHRAHYVEAQDGPFENEDQAYAMFTLTDQSSQPYTTTVDVCGQRLRMEIDTGASWSIMSEETYRDLLKSECDLPLQDCDTQLRTYTGESLPILGRVMVHVKANQQEVELPVLVIQGKGPSLIGRDWLAKLRLNWREVYHLKAPDKLDELLDKHSSLFKEELGTLRGTKVRLHVKEGAKPKFCKARNVPYVMKEKLEKELKRLEDEHIITPVQFSEWAAPVVPVIKQNGSIRLCGDYKMTVNQVCNVESYPLPRIFSRLCPGDKHSPS